MRLLLNLLWAVFGGGLVIALEYTLAGLVLCLTVIGLPFGLQCFKLAGLGLFPFGREIESVRGAGAGSFVLDLLWFVVAGVWIFLSHLALALPLAASIIGIPFAYQHLKFAMMALAPFGQRVRTA